MSTFVHYRHRQRRVGDHDLWEMMRYVLKFEISNNPLNCGKNQIEETHFQDFYRDWVFSQFWVISAMAESRPCRVKGFAR